MIHHKRLSVALLAAALFLPALDPSAGANNHLLNNARTGYTSESFPPPYELAWTYQARHAPRPAWREPAWEVQRIDFDYAYAMAADEGAVYISFSSDHTVKALDLATGETRWRFFTEGPVRLAPTVAQGRVYFSSDDGWVYCLDAEHGDLVWKHRPNIPDERMIGNEQVISRRPARSGVLVDGDRAYTTFGMLSPEGIVVCCLNARNGEILWSNDASGTRYMTMPHHRAMGGVSPQGSLALCGDTLVVPCGRAAPAFFDAKTGRLLYNEAEGLFPGGAWTMTRGELAFAACEYLQKPNPVAPVASESDISNEASLVALNARTGEEVFHLQGALRGVVTDEGVLNLIGPKKLISVALDDVLRAAPDSYKAKLGSSEGHFVDAKEHARWQTPVDRVYELVQSGNTLIAGRRDAVTCFDATSGSKTWEATVNGDAHGLLLADDALLVSTTKGEIRCYRKSVDKPARENRPVRGEIASSSEMNVRAERLLETSGIDEGYAIALGDFSAETLAALARRTKLTINRLAPADENLNHKRALLANVGLYGEHVAIQSATPSSIPYTDYLANVILASVSSAGDLAAIPPAEMYRVLRPCGGVAIIECPESLRPVVKQWLSDGGVPENEVSRVDIGLRVERGPLEGAGAWTHEYADAGKSGASQDRLVKLPLKTLWFGSLGPADIVSRHYRAPAPLAVEGCLFVAGLEGLHAVDAYNGRVLWERELPGVGRWPAAYRGGCMVADEAGLYALQGRACLRLDPETGETLDVFKSPSPNKPAPTNLRHPNPAAPSPTAARKDPYDNTPVWEYLAVVGDTVVGSVGQPNVRKSWWAQAQPAATLLFAFHKTTGALKWTYEAENAIDATAIVVDNGKIILIDGLAQYELWAKRKQRSAAGKNVTTKTRVLYDAPENAETRVLKALDLATGGELWSTSRIPSAVSSLATGNGVILASVMIATGAPMTTDGTGLAAFDAADGSTLWSRKERAYPIIIGDAAYLPDAVDLRTGKPITRPAPLTGKPAPITLSRGGGCGRFAGAPNVLMKRSGSLGFMDIDQCSGVYHYPNVRASCWINMIAACGLVLVPEGSSSCPCAYNYKTSFAFMPDTRQNHWGLYSDAQLGKDERVERLFLNFGAPGDKVDDDGNIWFAVPRPSSVGPDGAGGMGSPQIAKLPVEILNKKGELESVRRNPDWLEIARIDGNVPVSNPWVYASGLSGPLKLRVCLGPEGAEPVEYRVTLHLLEGAVPNLGGVFDVLYQGRTGITQLGVDSRNGSRRHAEQASAPLGIAETLDIEIVPKKGPPPIIRGLSIKRAR